MLRFQKSRQDRLLFISSLDDAVDADTPEGIAGYKAYLADLDRSHLILRGEPTVLVLRPLTHEVVGLAAQLSRGLVVPGLYLAPQAALELVRLSCEEIRPAPEGWQEDEVYRFEYRRRVLAPQIMEQLPEGLLREAAQVLVETLPSQAPRASGDETDPFVPTPPEGLSRSSSGATSGSGSTPRTAPTARRRKGATKPGTSRG